MKVSLKAEMRNIDKLTAEKYGLPALVLMENAGHRTAEAVDRLLAGVAARNVCVLAGSGNNGGDALAAARHLHNMGAKLKVFLAGEMAHFSPATAAMHKALNAMGVEMHVLESDRDWDRLHFALKFTEGIVDGILGTGFEGELRKKTLRLIEEVNSAGKLVLSIDIPSGVEADTGRVPSVAVQAAATLSLGLPKVGQLLSPGAEFTGQLLVDDIGIPGELLQDAAIKQALLDDAMAAGLLPPRSRAAHKGSCGRILVVAGSHGMTGAAALAASSALRAGAGIVTLAVPQSVHDILETKLTEVMTVPLAETKEGILGGEEALGQLLSLAESYDAVLIGPGLGRAAETLELVRLFAARVSKPLILDADAIYAFSRQPDDLSRLPQVPVLTPHLGEMAGLLGVTVPELRESLLPIVREAAAEYQCVFVVKSECTLVAYPDGDAFFTTKGNAGMATAGSGDVLAGTIAGLMKQTESGLAPLLGVYLHGLAGDLAAEAKGEALIASDIREHLPAARMKLREMQYKQ
ncbi:NAD(P)H-hydrate dehydratase [Selenomonas caprae]|uniref:Bifunctional NAD(P)H-hydrate repair enzyme n=2 Tax=Selenomonas TaxID=970 RepID=A0A1I3E575_SELRU|nr:MULTISPECIES: NAD(P)H-hydrate dehydratase [Selenomonas]MBQ1890617.1 NAD(P)H-hydrate dehydratase [Selenomonas sp.]TYZ27395.1 NAD(P)H-hydrate dehydratase [Selenomonas caprae]SFH94115.1 NAD(P)H-hydrate epimerase [Selenomonas ruminantium]